VPWVWGGYRNREERPSATVAAEPSNWQVRELKPGVPSPYRATTSYVLEPVGLESPHVEALVLSTGSVISVSRRTKDASLWSMAVEMLEGSKWKQVYDVPHPGIQDEELSTRDVARICRVNGPNTLPLRFEAVHIERQVWRLWGKVPRLRLEERLRALPNQRARQAKVIYLQMVTSFEPCSWRRSQCETQIKAVARTLRLVPNRLIVRLPYAEELGKAAMRAALHRVVERMEFSSCLTGFIANRIRVVRPKEAGSFPKYYTHRRMTNAFGQSPPPCSNRCLTYALLPPEALSPAKTAVCAPRLSKPHIFQRR
jgi:hypothetical protein